MSWFNYIGLIIIAVIMIPNVVFAMTNKDGFENKYKNKSVETLEQIGRFACFILMIFNIPYTYFGFWFMTITQYWRCLQRRNFRTCLMEIRRIFTLPRMKSITHWRCSTVSIITTSTIIVPIVTAPLMRIVC